MSELAKKLIAENKRTQAKSLDLGRCGLTDLKKEVPELFELIHLEELGLIGLSPNVRVLRSFEVLGLLLA